MALTVEMLIKILFVYSSLTSAILVALFVLTPAIQFLLARLPDRVPLIIIKSGGRLKIVVAKLVGGVLTTKKHGTYRETPGSGYIFKRLMTFFAYDNYGSTMPFDYVHVIQTLRDRGYEINTFEDLQKLWNDPKTKEEVIGLGYSRTLKVKDMQYLWPANDNPFINEAKEAIDVTIERKKAGKDIGKILAYAFLAVIIAYIGWQLFKNYGAGAPPAQVICQFPEQIINGMSNQVMGNVTI
jgi:hypothetical protein